MNTKRSLPLLILLMLLLAACAGASADDVMNMEEREAGGQTQSIASSPPLAPEPAMDSAVGEEGIAFTGANEGDGFEAAAGQPLPGQQERLIIRTANLNLLVSNTEEALATIGRMAEQGGGWIVSSNVYQYSADAKSGDITIRVPASGFNEALAALRELAVEVQHESISGQDVTEEYVDLDSRLSNLEATAERVRSFLGEAETVEEALAVNQELSRLEGEIEVIKGRMQYLSQSAAFSTIVVSLTPDIVAQPVQVGAWRPLGIAKEAVEALVGTLQGLAGVLIWIGLYILPVALLIGLPLGLIGRIIWRRWRRGRTEAGTTAASTD